MAKALFLSLPLYGHINPSLPLVQELVGRGEEVVYYSSEPFADKIKATGAQYWPYQNEFLRDIKHLPHRMDELIWLLTRSTAELLEHEIDAFRAEQPDYIITDSVAPWGQWIGELLNVPVVTSISTFALNRHVMAFGVSRGVRPKSTRIFVSKLRYIVKSIALRRQLRRQHRVHGPRLMEMQCGRSKCNIVYTSRYFQPCADTFDNSFHFVGPSIAARQETDHFPWEQVRHPIIVYVSLGTLFNTETTFYLNCFEAFGKEDCQVIMSIGTQLDVASLGQAPANFLVQNHVPQLEVLQRAAVFITHGGMNSVSESLYHCVPTVVVPQMGEQQIVGRRVEQLGAGLYLANQEATPEKLRTSVQRLLSEDQFREQTAVVREFFLTAGGVQRAADAIISFTR